MYHNDIRNKSMNALCIIKRPSNEIVQDKKKTNITTQVFSEMPNDE